LGGDEEKRFSTIVKRGSLLNHSDWKKIYELEKKNQSQKKKKVIKWVKNKRGTSTAPRRTRTEALGWKRGKIL